MGWEPPRGTDGVAERLACDRLRVYNSGFRRTVMPLRDHFRSPVNDSHSWDEIHGGWPMEILRDLFKILPAGVRAPPNVHLRSAFEVEVTTYEFATAPDSKQGRTATNTTLSPTLTIEAELSEQD